MKLPLPVDVDGTTYTEAVLRMPEARTVADSKRESTRGDSFAALIEWVAGSIKELTGDGKALAERADVKRAARAMTFETALAVALYSMAAMKKDDGISSTVECPSCGAKVRRERKEVDGEEIDTRDHLQDLSISYGEGHELIAIDLDQPVEILKKGTEEPIITATQLTFRVPTMGDCSRANGRVSGDQDRLQLAIEAEALVAVNGEEMSSSWKATFAMLLVERMTIPDANRVGKALKGFGIDPTVERRCFACQEEWEEPVNVMGFFASGLR